MICTSGLQTLEKTNLFCLNHSVWCHCSCRRRGIIVWFRTLPQAREMIEKMNSLQMEKWWQSEGMTHLSPTWWRKYFIVVTYIIGKKFLTETWLTQIWLYDQKVYLSMSDKLRPPLQLTSSSADWIISPLQSLLFVCSHGVLLSILKLSGTSWDLWVIYLLNFVNFFTPWVLRSIPIRWKLQFGQNCYTAICFLICCIFFCSYIWLKCHHDARKAEKKLPISIW